MTATDVAPILLIEPVTGLVLRAGSMTMYNSGDSGITFSFHKILVLPEELVKATQSLVGMGLIVFKNNVEVDPKPDDSVMMVQVVNDMKRTSDTYSIENDKVRLYYIYDYLHVKLVRTPLIMSEIVESENVKLLEES